jgi:hypothetical protein
MNAIKGLHRDYTPSVTKTGHLPVEPLTTILGILTMVQPAVAVGAKRDRIGDNVRATFGQSLDMMDFEIG